ncbi:MAG: tetratricopeptide repeat protein [Acidobacteriota bacterium]|nr:tetratricopeptide repeat protein [Acidobacteriota bacterium]
MTAPYTYRTTMWYWLPRMCLLVAPALGSAQDVPNNNGELSPPAKRVLKTERQKWTALRDAKRLSQKADVYEQQGKATEAEQMAAEALALEEQVRGPWHIEVARRLDQVADLYTAHKKEGAAQPLYERARAIRERALSTHPDVY